MKKALLTSAIVAGLSIASFTANASGKHTISVGYAQSDVKLKLEGDKLDKNPKGVNLKYRYEINDNWGVISSFTLTREEEKMFLGNIGKLTREITYRSWMAGPTYRFNEYVSTYALIGAANIEDYKTGSGLGVYMTDRENKTAVAYGAGLQFNPISNVAVDVTYEYSDLEKAKVGTFVVGVGYRF
ncbi:Ail/Lom family outer membrane beta-barrel protein [Xenorhabdus sp. XENO-10]|uniref:Ail/Lom family outer membrane beta-barrel protein n=1 Tax=Xenorhabdus yunnanensis TaxID=3025878 RepID=A0ABT5LEF5_9GAMM|nr:Ail/Lom family outer membrane beta-barrel protein [Xenorhabdus yunnanensis]MDC9588871.1 Ail/Lom family outer membrane beta-barrel protein [Xenorhabdus yunnanensis]